MIGRKLALFALFLSLTCAVGSMVSWFAYRELVRREAREYAQYWFDLQMSGNVQKSAGLVALPGVIPGAFGTRETTKEERAETALEVYRNRAEVKALQALAGKAQIRYYDTEYQELVDRDEKLRQVYAVTYDKKGTKTTFFIRLYLERAVPADKSVGIWRISDIRGGIKPIALGGVDES